MRRGCSTKPNVIKDENGRFVGFDLGADFCSEHEWGIKKLRSALGMSKNKIGIERYTATRCPEKALIIRTDAKKECSILICIPDSEWYINSNPDHFSSYETVLKQYNSDLGFYDYRGQKPEERAMLAGAWDEASFGIHTRIKEYTLYLQHLKDAILRGDAVIMVRGTLNPFENGGLVVAIRSRIPAEVDTRLKEQHLDRQRLERAAADTKIVERVNEVNSKHYADKGFRGESPCGYFALSPSWAGEWNAKYPNRQTKHSVIFFLNPMNQRERYWGRVTVEEIEDWMQGKGFIMQKEHSNS